VLQLSFLTVARALPTQGFVRVPVELDGDAQTAHWDERGQEGAMQLVVCQLLEKRVE
jgi:hypothetical protein